MKATSKWLAIVAVALVTGSFLASPELRAYASTIANDVICNGCVGTTDLAGNSVTAAKIKDAEVKAAEIAADAVGASEIQGVTKLIFAQCSPTATQKSATTPPQTGFAVQCSVSGSDSDDSASATLNDTSHCFRVASADPANNLVNVTVKNECTFNASLGALSSIALIVYDK